MAEKPEHIRYINQVLDAGISRQTLMDIYKICAPRRRYCLIGFNDYAKHIINLLPDSLEAIIDDDPRVHGINYRGKTVVGSDIELECRVAVIVKYEYLSEYTALLKKKYQDMGVFMPGRFGDIVTRFSQPITHDPYLRYVFQTWEDAPNTMMGKDKIMFLAELFRSCVSLPGDVAEFGVWQGGSAYALMRGAQYLNADKEFILFDLFESLDRGFKEAIMCDEEIKRTLSPLARFDFVSGDMNEKIDSYRDRKFCFVHYDLGYHPKVLDFLLDRTVPGGVIVFDNYGFSNASPELYQSFYRERGQQGLSVPFSEQGFMIRR